MKKYTISLLMSYTSDDLEDIGVEHPTDDEVQKWMEGKFEELIQSGDFINGKLYYARRIDDFVMPTSWHYIETDFKVEEV